MTLLFMLLLSSLLRFMFWLGWLFPLAFLWLLRPAFWVLSVSLVLAVLAPRPVLAGWLWDTPPDPKIEAANQALERAAQIATEAARTQSGQQGQLLSAVEALSSERTHLAGHLQALSELAHRDSAWASAVHAAVPMLVASCVLGVAALAIWLTARAGDSDAQLASVLVDEFANPDSPLLIGPKSVKPKGQIPALKYEASSSSDSNIHEQEMPF